MSFRIKEPRPRTQVSLNAFSDKTKERMHAVGDAAGDAGRAVGRGIANVAGHAADAGQDVIAAGADLVGSGARAVGRHAKEFLGTDNKDLKHRASHKSGRAIDN